MSIENLLNMSSAGVYPNPRQRYKAYLLPYILAMAAANVHPNGDVIDYVTDDEYRNPEKDKQAALKEGAPLQQAEDIAQGAKTTNYINSLWRNYETSGKKRKLDYILNKEFKLGPSKSLDEIKETLATKRMEGAVAFTDRENVIGGPFYMEQEVEKIAREMQGYGISHKIAKAVAEDYIITHEETHTAHPDYVQQNIGKFVEKNGPYAIPLAITLGKLQSEVAAEFVTAYVMEQRSKEATTTEEQKAYKNASEHALKRYGIRMNQLNQIFKGNQQKESSITQEAVEALVAYAILSAYAQRKA